MALSNPHRRVRSGHGTPLIVHSHLRWDFVWQRPQHILTRLAQDAPVLFLEEPIFLDDVADGHLDITEPSPNVYRAVPRLPASLRGNYDASIAEVRSLALAALGRGEMAARFESPVQWFYTPMPAPAMLGAFREVGVVYDCMDELSKFRFAPPDLVRRERMLMEAADIIFTGGRRLWEAKSQHHRNVHFFGCGVDNDHFARARDAQTPVPDDMAWAREIEGKVAGYYGVIDERLDYDLIAQLAASDPALHVVMVGPTAKVDPAALPQASNLHWMGQRSYGELPNYVRVFDVCLMPFALNEATEYINPTKTLEYMAAGRPIVSTAVADVVRNFTPVVRVARDAEDFVRGVMLDARHPSAARIADGINMARAHSWDATVRAMRDLMLDAVDTRVEREAQVERVLGRQHDRQHDRVPERTKGLASAPSRAAV
jgi:glycosyltransferase involved in cell wall biosynthesis